MGADTDGDGVIFDNNYDGAQTGIDDNVGEGESENE